MPSAILVAVVLGAAVGRAQPAPLPADVRVMAAPASALAPRNSEASVAVLRDGTLMMAYGRFLAGLDDDDDSDLLAITSSDGGQHWSAPRTVVERDARSMVMSPSLLRLATGELALVYARKRSPDDCAMYWRTSPDDGRTWTAETRVSPPSGYGAALPDALIQLRSGRLLVPEYRVFDQRDPVAHVRVAYSDNGGRAWHQAPPLFMPDNLTAEEPSAVETADGRVVMLIRTVPGPYLQSVSDDGGRRWSTPTPITLVQPRAPAHIDRIPGTGDLVCLWNDSVSDR